MRVDRIQPQDLVKLRIKDRVLYGEVLEVADGIVRFRPLCPRMPGSSWNLAAVSGWIDGQTVTAAGT